MASIILAIIYVAFISLGLPDSLTGSAWPVMYKEFEVSLSSAGIITMMISGGTIVSSLMSDKMTRRFGTAMVTAVSVVMTAIALFGFSISTEFWMLLIWTIPYGLGAGAIDAALNNYVALHYSSRDMSWLHSFWGVGTIISPYIMSFALARPMSWSGGYRMVSIVQFGIAILLFISLPLWKKVTHTNTEGGEEEAEPKALTLVEAIKIKGVLPLLCGFFGYCSLETTMLFWASTYMVQARDIPVNTAAAFASLFCIGITVGRFLCGFISNKVGDKNMIRLGIGITFVGIIAIMIPITSDYLTLAGFIITGLGCAPVYPSIIHSTPFNFGKENSQAIIGIQMASAYVGSTFMPPLFGLIANNISIKFLPYFVCFFGILLLYMTEKLNKIVSNR